MIVKIKPYENGSHANQSMTPTNIPDGWAVAPDDMALENFPFGEITTKKINGVVTVTKWTPGVVPDPTPEVSPEVMRPTTEDILNTLLGVTK